MVVPVTGLGLAAAALATVGDWLVAGGPSSRANVVGSPAAATSLGPSVTAPSAEMVKPLTPSVTNLMSPTE